MKPPFFVCSRPYRTHSFAGVNAHNALRSPLLLRRHNKTPLKQSLPLPFFHSDETCRLSSPHFHSRKHVLLTRAPSVPTITATCFIEVPTCSRFLPRGAEKSETFCANKGTFIRKRPTFSPNRATSFWNAPRFSTLHDFSCGMARILCCIVLLLLLDCAISFAFPRRTLHTPSNASTPSPIVHPQRPLLLCLPSVNSLSTTTAAP